MRKKRTEPSKETERATVDGRKNPRVRAASKLPVRLSDVAALAGVSAGTVSRIFSAPHMVAPETAKIVREAIDKLGWVPHGGARALASNRSRTIGAIIPNLANPIFAKAIYAIQATLLLRGYILMIGCSEYDPEKALLEARAMIERGIDGLILLGENFTDSFWHLLAVQKIPHLVIYTFGDTPNRHYVGFDNIRAARAATDFLLDLGHREFAILAQEVEGNDRAAARLRGFIEALEVRKVRIPSERIIQSPWSIGMGQQAFASVIRSGSIPTAVVCSNDYLAIGAISACREAGLRVPEDVSIVGFDDSEVSAFISPALTTVRVPAADIGHRAAETIVGCIEGTAPLRSVEFQTELVVRRSTAPAPR